MHAVSPAEIARPARTAPYRLREVDEEAVLRVAAELTVSPAMARILVLRGVAEARTARDFLQPRLAQLTSPAGMIGRSEAAKRLAQACRNKERVAVFGDYDVDGTTSAAILCDALEHFGAEVAGFVANRFAGGYGLSDIALDRVLEWRPTVLVTCDCGSADAPRVARAKASGCDVIVVDHHLVPDEPLEAVAFLNPHRPECGFPFKGMCSAGLAFSVVAALRTELGVDFDVKPWLDLVALGTVADVAPLVGDNRALVRAGLALLGGADARPGVMALREVAKIKSGRPLSAFDIAFRMAPRLNASGRLADAALTLELLRSKTLSHAREVAKRIEALNEERKRVERQTTEEAIVEVERHYGRHPESGVVVAGRGWHRGVVGISAARLVDQFSVPAIVIAMEEEGGRVVGHGSARTPPGFHLHDALSACQQHLIRFGGHAAAAGVTVDERELDGFRAAFAAHGLAGMTPVERWVDVALHSDSVFPTPSELESLEPLGHHNPAPRFALERAKVVDARIVGESHLRLRVVLGKNEISVFARDQAHVIDDVGERVTILGDLRPDTWRGHGLECSALEVLLLD